MGKGCQFWKQHLHAVKLWETWVGVTIVAELVGIGAIAALTLNLGQVDNTATNTLLLSIGIAEGLILGVAQWWILRRYVRHAVRWIFATTIGTLLAWALGVPISFLLVVMYGSHILGSLNPIALLRGILLLGAGVGIIVGYCQWLVIQAETSYRSQWWVIASAIAWALGLALAYLLSNLTIGFQTSITIALIGTAMGAVVGGITGLALIWMMNSHLRS